MKSSEFLIENVQSYNKQIIDALKSLGYKVEEREKSAGALKTWLATNKPMNLEDLATKLSKKIPGTKFIPPLIDTMDPEIKGPGFKIEPQGKGSIFVAVYAGPRKGEYAVGLDV